MSKKKNIGLAYIIGGAAALYFLTRKPKAVQGLAGSQHTQLYDFKKEILKALSSHMAGGIEIRYDINLGKTWIDIYEFRDKVFTITKGEMNEILKENNCTLIQFSSFTITILLK